MKPHRLIVAVIAAAAVIVLYVAGQKDDSTSAPEGAVAVTFPYSPEKEELLAPLIDEFNKGGAEVDGMPVFVEAEVLSSGEAEQEIAAGRLEPVAWSTASSLWGRLLNFEADQELVPDDAPSIVNTPLVIAMWEPMARALGWPERVIGWSDILALARSEAGWAAYGHPEFGDFKLVHTNPEFSTSGLSASSAEYYAAIGKHEGLVEEDISGQARETVREIERSIVHYGDTTLFIADQLRENGPSYASAAAMEEVTLLDFNLDRGGQPKLVAIYPKEGTFYSDNPFFILNGDWVSAEERAGAEAFQKFLAERITPELAAESGFRPADLDQRPVPPVTRENGADPSQPKRVLALPSPRVLAKIRDAWQEDRKPANVMLVVDVSGSMADEQRLTHAKRGLTAFLEQIQPEDRVGLIAFDDRVQELVPLGPFSQNEPTLRAKVAGLFPDGGTAYRDAISEGFRKVDAIAAGANRINAVVVLTDGEDTDSTKTLPRVVNEVSQGDSPTQIQVFTIAYSATAEGAAAALEQIAKVSGGQFYEGGTEDIELVYRSISSFF
jgi:Ca-activated chloride channel family protein